MSEPTEVIHGPAPAFDGPVVCTLSAEDLGPRLADFRDLFRYLLTMERPEPTRLHLVLAEQARVEAVRELLVREQQCCGFLAFTIRPEPGRVLVDLEVRQEAAPVLDGLAGLAAPPATDG